jgi:membrane protein required for colicin V production
MAAGMNWLDYALIIILGLSVLRGLSHGALRMLTSILSFALAIYAASTWHGRAEALAQTHLGTSPVSSEIIGYAAIFLVTFILVEIVGQRATAFAELIHLKLIDRLAGAVLGAVLGAIIGGLNITVLTALLPANSPLLQNSELAPEILAYNQKMLGYIPTQLRLAYEDKREQLARYWNLRQNQPATTPSSAR